MRKTNWLFLTTLTAVGITLVASAAVLQLVEQTYPQPLPQTEPADASSYGRLALELAKRERYSEALQANQQALGYDPENATLYFNQGWIQARQGEWQAALNSLNRSLELNPRLTQALYNRAWIYQQLKQTQASQRDLQTALQQGWKPTTPLEQARVLQLQNRHADALKQLQQAQGQAGEVDYWLSRSYLALKRWEEARQALDRVLAIQSDAGLYHDRAQVNLKLGQPEAAHADLQQSLRLDNDTQTRLALVALQIEADPTQALETLKPLLREENIPLNVRLLELKARLRLNPATAREALAKELTDHPQAAQLWLLQAQDLRQRRKYTDASDALQRARQQGLNGGELALESARLAAQQGQRATAQQRLEQALKLRPDLRTEASRDRLLRKMLNPPVQN
ncbi:MAG: tetratricopeptide repeat protein [Candidatus Sericytochromatia bacterium]